MIILNVPQDVLIYLQLQFLDPIFSFQFSITCKYLYNIYIQNIQLKFQIYHKYIQYKRWDNGLRKASKVNQ
jgi:hypothetical protein